MLHFRPGRRAGLVSVALALSVIANLARINVAAAAEPSREQVVNKAIDYLRAKGLSKAAKKAGREATEGAVVSYIHGGGKIGVLVEINCETDFVARNEDFINFTRDVALQIAAMNAQFVRKEEVSADVIEHIEDDVGFLRDVASILPPGGVVAITVPAFQTLYSPDDPAASSSDAKPATVYLHEFSVWMRSPASNARCAPGQCTSTSWRASRCISTRDSASL